MPSTTRYQQSMQDVEMESTGATIYIGPTNGKTTRARSSNPSYFKAYDTYFALSASATWCTVRYNSLP